MYVVKNIDRKDFKKKQEEISHNQYRTNRLGKYRKNVTIVDLIKAFIWGGVILLNKGTVGESLQREGTRYRRLCDIQTLCSDFPNSSACIIKSDPVKCNIPEEFHTLYINKLGQALYTLDEKRKEEKDCPRGLTLSLVRPIRQPLVLSIMKEYQTYLNDIKYMIDTVKKNIDREWDQIKKTLSKHIGNPVNINIDTSQWFPNSDKNALLAKTCTKMLKYVNQLSIKELKIYLSRLEEKNAAQQGNKEENFKSFNKILAKIKKKWSLSYMKKKYPHVKKIKANIDLPEGPFKENGSFGGEEELIKTHVPPGQRKQMEAESKKFVIDLEKYIKKVTKRLEELI